jgi:ABC-type transport system involved in multi-copper enzyme maturation permease subunit
MSIIQVNMLGVDVATILLLLFVAIQIGREFQSKTIQLYLVVTPARSRYFIAKALAFCFVSLAVGVIVALVTLFNGQLLVSAVHKQMPASSAVWQFAAGCIVMPPFYVLLTVCAAFSARNTATGIVMPLIVLFLPAIAKLFPKMLQNMVIPALPASAIHTLSGVAQKGSIEYTGILAAFVILGFWVLLSAALSIWKFRKKDI